MLPDWPERTPRSPPVHPRPTRSTGYPTAAAPLPNRDSVVRCHPRNAPSDSGTAPVAPPDTARSHWSSISGRLPYQRSFTTSLIEFRLSIASRTAAAMSLLRSIKERASIACTLKVICGAAPLPLPLPLPFAPPLVVPLVVPLAV